jgi:hypothetical protein
MKKIILRSNIHVESFLVDGFKEKIHKFHEWLNCDESYPSYQDIEHILVITRQYRTIYRNLVNDNPQLEETIVDIIGGSLNHLRKRLVPFVKERKKAFIESGRESWLM